jgi:hypothetical protein
MNAFSRLKHYRLLERSSDQTKNDSKENHATEVLAACLEFSPVLQTAFRRLCRIDDLGSTDPWKVETQLGPEGEQDRWDLVLIKRDADRIVNRAVIEVKVNAPPEAEQLWRYRRQLSEAKDCGTWSLLPLRRSWVNPPPNAPRDCVAISWDEAVHAFERDVANLESTNTDRRLF